MKKIILSFLFVIVSIIIIFVLFGSFESFSSSLLSAYSDDPVKYIGTSFIILATDVVMPVPSSILMYLNGYTLGVVSGSILSWISLMTSSVLAYAIGKYNPFKYLDNLENRSVTDLGPYLIIVSRGIPVLAEAISIMGGVTRMPIRKFILLHAIGYIPICVLYAYLGKYAINKNSFVLALGISIGITVLFWLAGYVLNYYKKAQI